MQCAQAVLSHEARHAVLAARLTRLAKVQEHARRTVYALAGRERGANEAQEALVFDGPMRTQTLKPLVVAARRNSQTRHIASVANSFRCAFMNSYFGRTLPALGFADTGSPSGKSGRR